MLKKQPDGKTLREHLEAAQKFTQKTPEELVGPELPPETRHWWDWWKEIASGRQCGMAANPISWADMAAWAQLTGRSLDPWDVTAIRCIDGEFMEVVSQDQKETSKPRKTNGR